MTEDNTVRNISSAAPYSKTALTYYRKGWEPMPLPAKLKFPPPTGFTGYAEKPIGDEEIAGWMQDPQHRKANIGLRMPRHGKKIVIGIDVDNYTDGEDKKEKRGGEQLADLERELGPLPDTWISSSRDDGVSGIRFFLAPEGFKWSGKAAKSIEVIQPHHRYAVAWPSWHPKGGQYQWFEPGSSPQGVPTADAPYVARAKEVNGVRKLTFDKVEANPIPFVEDLPDLPDAWVDRLTGGKIPWTRSEMDMDIKADDIILWGKKHYAKPTRKRCPEMKARVEYWKAAIKADPSSHDKILSAHSQIMKMGILEGHAGADIAIQQITNFWKINVAKRGKRTPEEARGEIFRSVTMGLRKLKAEVDKDSANGITYQTKCHCFDEANVDYGEGPKPTGKAKNPDEYERNDDGNGFHLMDLYGENLAYVPGYGTWMFWNGERWDRDEARLARRCFRRVKERQQAHTVNLEQAFRDALATAGGDDPEVKLLKAKWLDWKKWAESSGNIARQNNALEAAEANEGACIAAEELDMNPRLLGVENGIVELRDDGAFFRKAERADLVTVNTGIPYMPLEEQLRKGGDYRLGWDLWLAYLDRFIPDMKLRKFVQKAIGYCLLGQNTERIAIFLQGGTSTGKSTFLETVMAAMGGYAETVDLGIFKERASGLNPALAQALPRRIITASEISSQNHMHADIFKRITGGDRISAELKGVNTIVTRKPGFVPIIATNDAPTITGADSALIRRLLVIPFDQHVDRTEDDKSAALNLTEHSATAVLAWLVEGWRVYAQEGLDPKEWPQAVSKRTETFGGQLNEIGEFLADCTVQGDKNDSSVYVIPTEMYARWEQWCIQQGMKDNPYTVNKFGREMTRMGVERRMRNIPEMKTALKVYVGRKLIETPSSKFRTSRVERS